MAAMRLSWWSGISLIMFGLLAAGVAGAQDEAKSDKPVAEKPVVPPAASDERQPIMARVIEVHGDVKYAPLDSQDYKPCQLDDEYPEGTKIITGVRSSIKLQIGEEEPYTCMLIEAVGKTLLGEAYKTKDTKRVRVGVGYGRIRAGVAEGGLKSDFTVDSPVATLSKRGTWGFTLFYERDTDFFEIGLTNRGLVEAINKLTNERRTINPKELITSAMRLWLEQARFERNVSIPDILGQGDIEVAFNRLEQSGLGVLDPGAGQGVLLDLTTEPARVNFASLLGRVLPPGTIEPGPTHLRAEGFFGTGRGDQLIDVMIEASNPLVQQGYARPGTYKFRRSALASWLRDYKTAKP
jgi:hypothetical protein